MTWVAVAVGAGSLIAGTYAANKQSGAAKSAANASSQASQNSIAEQQREFNIDQQNQAPWLNTGKSALSTLAGMYGLNGGTSGAPAGATQTMFDGTTATPLNGSPGQSGEPNYSAFFSSPDYQFALQQGQGALDRDAANRGTLYSGGHTTDAIQFGQGLASQQFNNYANRLASLAGIGQTAANQLGYAGQSMANQVGNLNMANAANQMNSSYNKANAYSNLAGQFGQIGGQLAGYFMNQPQATQTSGAYTGPGAMGDYSQFTNPNVSSFYSGGLT